ncbi:MAG TPA: hypothetical protein VFW95_11200 [Candidatus Limnocylindria bacterium]|nr:hypothetical protein [Candidatus Limnocylindria bacterium]
MPRFAGLRRRMTAALVAVIAPLVPLAASLTYGGGGDFPLLR